MNYPLFPHESDSFHNIFHLIEDKEHFIWSPYLEIHAFDLSQFMVKWKKYRRDIKNNSSSELPWLMMLAAVYSKKNTIHTEIFQELEEMAMNEQEIHEALIEWESLSANKENKVLYEARLKYLRDQLSNIRGERKAGKEEGKKEDLREGMARLIQSMEKKGMKTSEIASMTELSEEEVKGLLADQL